MKITIYQESVIVISIYVHNNLPSQSVSLTERLREIVKFTIIMGNFRTYFQKSAHKRHQREKNTNILNYYKLNHKYEKIYQKNQNIHFCFNHKYHILILKKFPVNYKINIPKTAICSNEVKVEL